jgi:hypothetical protein
MHLGATGLNLINVAQNRNQLLYSEYSNECLGYIRREVLDQLNNYHSLSMTLCHRVVIYVQTEVFWILSPHLPIHGHSIYTGVK